MTEHARPQIPECWNCSKPLGLYYADCPVCLTHAHAYSLSDYEETP